MALTSSRSIFSEPNHSAGHSFSGRKSHWVLGTKKPFFAAVTTIARPTRPPMSEGNSGPRNTPVSA
ncbi:Uncharacterised protein [Vibrio cholerae]|nr:Uncharacterised protein [Vibrio cholerae]CSC45352.1 Uncharacterised protein [Vibrio cholerae]CSI80468.1 Uncharacterised protein [Vibrio cholerae]